MRINTCLGLLFILLALLCKSQDTIKVQTLTFDSAGRSYVFNFPTADHNQYSKILMQYRMRCKNALVSTGNDRNKGCGEWDYSCNTYITDSSRFDSTKASHPSHTISNYNDISYYYTTKKTYDLLKREQKNVVYNSTSNENKYAINLGNSAINNFNHNYPAHRIQLMYNLAELNFAGATAGALSGIVIPASAGSGTLKNFRISLKESTAGTLNQALVDFNGATEVFYQDYMPLAGDNIFRFYRNFNWSGNQSIVVEISFDMSEGAVFTPLGKNGNDGRAILANTDGYIDFKGIGHFSFKQMDFSKTKNAMSFSFWSFGDANYLGSKQSTIFEGFDNKGNRQVNVHLPWENKNVYWDCGSDNAGLDRVEKAAVANTYSTKWNHWAFSKDVATGRMQIYQNGTLFIQGAGKNKIIDLFELNIGRSSSSGVPYWGLIDDFRCWNTPISLNQAKGLMAGNEDTINALKANEQLYLRTNRNGFQEASSNANSFTTDGLVYKKQVLGNGIIRGFLNMPRPNLSFVRGTYNVSVSTLVKYDTIYHIPNQVISYQIVNNKPTAIDTNYYYSNIESYTYDEAGNVLSTSFNELNELIDISTLNYHDLSPSRFEIMSFVTPYGINLDLGAEGKMWEFDVTDFGPILKGAKLMSLERGGEFQEQMDIQFLFIKGTPSRNVIDINQVWKVDQVSYGNIANNTVFEARNVPVPQNATMAKLRSVISGHGQEGEFIARKHSVNVNNGAKRFEWDVWTECSDNPVFPQGGTWVFDRAGWCPGAPTDIKEYDLSPYITPGQSIKVDYGVATATGDSRYIPSHQIVYYGAPNFSNDAAVIDVKRPSDKVEYTRFNAACSFPEIIIQNNGSQTLTNLQIEYWVNSNQKLTYNWTGSLAYLQKTQVILPVNDLSFWDNASANATFHAQITNNDQESSNNLISRSFKLAPTLPTNFILDFKTNNNGFENSYIIKNIKGETVYSKTGLAANKVYADELILPAGCYQLEWKDSGEDGLDFFYWAAIGQSRGTGYFRIKSKTGSNIKTFNPDYGKNIFYEFTTSDATGVNEIADKAVFNIFPNPNQGKFTLYANTGEQGIHELLVRDVLGKTVYQEKLNLDNNANYDLDLSNLKAGVYIISLHNKNGSLSRQLVIQ